MMDTVHNNCYIYFDTLSLKKFRQYVTLLIGGYCTKSRSKLSASPSTAKIPWQFVTVHLAAATVVEFFTLVGD